MIRVAIVEDDAVARAVVREQLDRYTAETGTAFTATEFSDAVSFLDSYRPVYDLVLLDVELPYLYGTEAAKRLRELDPVVLLVFMTNMAQYAIHGYAVNALDYILKPVSYARLRALLGTIRRLLAAETGTELAIRTPKGLVRVRDRDILYVTAEDHLLLYHTAHGIVESWDTLKTAETLLPKERFFRIGKSVIVNLYTVKVVDGDTVRVGEATFPISRAHKRDFWAALQTTIGGSR